MRKRSYWFLVLLALTSCMTDAPRSRRVLEESGFTEIQIGGYAWSECAKGDDYHTEFSAKGPSGHAVTGAVCCGVWKSCTVRIR